MWLGAKYSSDWARENGKVRQRNPDAAAGGFQQSLEDQWRELNEFNRLKAKYPDTQAPAYDEHGLPDDVAHLKLLREMEQQEPEPEVDDQDSDAIASDLPRRTPRNYPLPQRDPGWYVSPDSVVDSRYGVPPMPRRTPGDAMVPSGGPGYAPPQQSMEDWVQWLRGKGIRVDHTLQRPDAARPPVESNPDRPLTGPEIWPPLVGPGEDGSLSAPTDEDHLIDVGLRNLPESDGGLGRSLRQRVKDFVGRRKASATVTDYIKGVLAAVDGD